MKLTKIKLINWHLFSNNTIELKGNTLLSGENGTGKSTLVDAIYYVLSAGDDKHFNHAANQNAKRTLEAYMRYKTGIENKKYMRNDSEVITHIALEYENDKGKEPFVVGVCLELSNGNTRPQAHFYFANNYRIKDTDYIVNGKICNHIMLSKNIGYDSWDKYTSQTKRRDILAKQVFKLSSPDKYYELLSKAIAFKPIEEVSNFVDGFLLKEKNINLDNLRLDMRNYNEIHKLVVREELKLNALNKFIHNAEEYRSNETLMKYLDIVKILIRIDDSKQGIENHQNEISMLDAKIETNRSEIKRLDDENIRLTKEISLYENDEAYLALKQKEETLVSKTIELDLINNDIKRFDVIAKQENEIAVKAGLKTSFYSDYKNQDFLSFTSSIREYDKRLNSFRNDSEENKAMLKVRDNTLTEEINNASNQLANIKKGIKDYDEKLKTLVEIIQETLLKNRKKKVEVVPFVEYLEIKKGEEAWQNALEGYLNTQRFDLIIDPQYYNDAIKIYEAVKDKLEIYGIGIVDVKKINEEKEIKDSLYSKLVISNKYAKKYAQLLLNNVICVDDVLDLNKYKVSITKTGMVYKNYCTRAINKSVWEKPFIGRDSLKKQEELLEQKLKSLSNDKTKILNELSKITNQIDAVKNSKAYQLKDMKNLWDEFNTISKNIERLTAEIESDKKSTDLLALDEKLRRAKENQNRIRHQTSILHEENSAHERSKGKLESDIRGCENQIEYDKKAYDEKYILIKEDNVVLSDYLNTINRYRNGDRFNKAQVNREYDSADRTNRALKSGIQNGMQDYSKDYKPELTATFENLGDYIDEYYQIKNRDVVKYKEKANESYEKCREGFRQYFLMGIRTNINEAKSEISKLNKTLKKHPFAGETYEFVLYPNKDLGDYYRIITSGNEIESKDLFTETLNEADLKLIEELFNKVASSDGSTENEKYIQKYLDYREYMRYDIKVTNAAGESSYVSETAREKSGGETQTPFYVVIAACFDELMNKDKKDAESCCLVIFDEAFNNMDEGRIQSVLNFYKELSIQLFIVVPGIRTYSIAPYMDSVIGITKIDNKAVVFHEAGK